MIGETRRSLAKTAPHAPPFFEGLLSLDRLQIVDPSPALVLHIAEDIELKDAPVVAGALPAGASFLATYDRKHLLAHADLIRATFGIIVETPEAVLASL